MWRLAAMLFQVKGVRPQRVLFFLSSFLQGLFEVEFDARGLTGDSRDLLVLKLDENASGGDEFIDQPLLLAADRAPGPEGRRGSHRLLNK